MAAARTPEASASIETTAAPPMTQVEEIGLRDGVRRLLLGLVLIYGGFVAVNAARWEPRHPPIEIVLDVAMVGFLLGWLALYRRASPTVRNGHSFAVGGAAAAIANVVASALVTRDPLTLSFVPYITIGVGAIVLSLPVFAGIAALATTGALLAAAAIPEADLLMSATANAAAAVVGYAIYAARMRSLARLRQLRATEAALEAQLREAQKLESVGVLAGGMAHDMNNVLGAITSIATAASEDPDASEALRNDLRHIVAAGQRGAALTKNLLGFAGRGKQRSERVDLADTVAGVVELLARTIPKGIALTSEISPGLPPVLGDSGQIGHLLMNLCINAVDAIGERGHVTIRVEGRTLDTPTSRLSPGSYLAISVVDDGAGMSEETVSRVFEPFFSTKRDKGRSGLGLSMVYGTVRQHGGDVRIESTVGVGTTVEVLLPALEAGQRAAPVSPPPRVMPAHLHVLVIDDEPLVRRGVERLLSALGASVTTASSGDEGVARYCAAGGTVSCVLLDLAMPGKSGAETFDALRAVDPDVRVVIASGYPRGQDIDRLIQEGVRAFLTKPFTKDALVDALAKAVAQRRREPSLAPLTPAP